MKQPKENIKDQLLLFIIMLASRLGRDNDGNVKEDFIQDALQAMETMNGEYIVYMSERSLKGHYGKFNPDVK